MKSILLVAPGSMYGGGEVYIKNFVTYLKDNTNMQVYVGVCNSRLKSELEQIADNVFYVFDSSKQVNKLINSLIINIEVIKYKIDAVFLNGLPECGLLSFLILSKNIVCIGHSNESHLKSISLNKGVKSNILRFLFKLAFNKLNLFIAINNVAYKNVLSFYPNYRKIVTIYNGVPPVFSENKSKNLNGTIKLGRISRLTKEKNIELAIDCVKKIKDSTLIISGDGEYRQFLEQYASGYNVHFTGHTSPQSFFSNIDIMLLTTASDSDNDATPLVIAEAMSAGIPVVSTRVGGVPEMISDGVDGFLCDDNAESFVDTIHKIQNTHGLYEYLSKNSIDKYNKSFTTDLSFSATLDSIFQFNGRR